MVELNKYLNRKDFNAVITAHKKVKINPDLAKEIEKNHQFLKDFSKNKIIYGVNTGFGPMAQYRVSDEDGKQLQYNLIRSHASGSGKVIPTQHIRAAMLARLNSICQLKSGVHPSVPALLVELLNKEIYPVVFEHGGVGASGDLVQLAHIALGLIGEGEVIYKVERRKTAEVFAEENIKPIEIHIREGLALMNGTSNMTGIGLVNHQKAKNLMRWSLSFSAIINEIVQAYDDHFSAVLNQAKNHKGQQKIAEEMRNHLADSQLIKNRSEHLYSGRNTEMFFKEKVQEYYSLRCIPQILGPVYDTINYTGKVLEDELNSANDNPIVDSEKEQVVHGGNFHGDYISLEMDKLKLGITRISMLAERQLNFLVNDKLNQILPPFVNRGKLGLNYGVQGMQFTATSTTAENQTLSNSMYVHSIPNNNDNQDIVSMGTNAAQLTAKIIENTYEVLSVELIAIYQAVKYLKIMQGLSSESRKILVKLENIIPDMIEDQAGYVIIEKAKQFLKAN